MRLVFALLAAALLLGAPQRAVAGSAATPADVLTPEEVVTFAKQIERDLASKRAFVAMVFRTGRARADLPDGIGYTHGAFWIYVPVTTPSGETLRGYAVYNLYRGSEDVRHSYLKQDFPVDFVAGSVVYDVGVLIPSPEVQRRILKVVFSDDYKKLHNPNYSLISNPHTTQFQNCNEFMLDVVVAGIYGITDQEQLAANLRAYFEPATIKLSLLERLFGPMVEKSARLEDQHGDVKTATYESMVAYMAKYGYLQEAYVLNMER